mgnify:CR=1 FL=1
MGLKLVTGFRSKLVIVCMKFLTHSVRVYREAAGGWSLSLQLAWLIVFTIDFLFAFAVC